MNKQVIYDNHANNIEYFDLNRPKIKVMKKDNRLDIKSLSNNELLEKITETQIKREELTIMYNMTKSESTLEQVSKITSFISVMRAEVRKRNIDTYDNLNMKIISLESQLTELKNQPPNVNQKLNLANQNLKHEIKALKKKNLNDQSKQLSKEINDLKEVIRKNREAEKTKRHLINIKNEKYAFEYVKKYLSQVISKEEMDGVFNDLKEMRIEEEKQLNQNTPQ